MENTYKDTYLISEKILEKYTEFLGFLKKEEENKTEDSKSSDLGGLNTNGRRAILSNTYKQLMLDSIKAVLVDGADIEDNIQFFYVVKDSSGNFSLNATEGEIYIVVLGQVTNEAENKDEFLVFGIFKDNQIGTTVQEITKNNLIIQRLLFYKNLDNESTSFIIKEFNSDELGYPLYLGEIELGTIKKQGENPKPSINDLSVEIKDIKDPSVKDKLTKKVNGDFKLSIEDKNLKALTKGIEEKIKAAIIGDTENSAETKEEKNAETSQESTSEESSTASAETSQESTSEESSTAETSASESTPASNSKKDIWKKATAFGNKFWNGAKSLAQAFGQQ